MNPMKVPVTVEVSEDRILDLITSAWEGGSAYWATSDKLPYKCISEPKPGMATPLEWGLNLPVKVYDKENEKKAYVFDLDAIQRGLNVMAKDYPKHFGDFMNDNDDAITADVFLQCCLFGGLVYG